MKKKIKRLLNKSGDTFCSISTDAQKRMRALLFKENAGIPDRLTRVFYATVIMCIAGAIISTLLFFKNYFYSYHSLDEQPIAYITAVHKTAQRKFQHKAAWNRLHEDSPVFNGDTIYTALLSEATLYFPANGSSIDLAENTMVQVFLQKDNSASASLSSGTALIDTSRSASRFTLDSGGVQMHVQSGATVSASSGLSAGQESPLSVQVVQGSATFGKEEIKAGEAVSLQADVSHRGANVRAEKRKISVESPAPNAKIILDHKTETPVLFSWHVLGEETIPLVLEASQTRNFGNRALRTTVTDVKSTRLSLTSGKWYWQFKSEDAILEAGVLHIDTSAAPKLTAPTNEAHITYAKTSEIRFSWKAAPVATSYILCIADNERMEHPQVQKEVSLTSCKISALPNGTWFWSVHPQYKGIVEIENLTSPVYRFTVQQEKKAPDAPKLISPVKNAKIIPEKADGAVSWKAVENADFYTLKITQDTREQAGVAIEKKIYANSVLLSDFALPYGDYVVAVSVTDKDGSTSLFCPQRAFFVVPEKKEIVLLEPKNAYTSDDVFLKNLVFSFKTEGFAGKESAVQFSRQKSFSSIEMELAAHETRATGATLAPGLWYWRVVSKTKDGDEFVSLQRTLSVKKPLEKPAVSTQNGELRTTGTEEAVTLSWGSVSNADFYTVSLFEKNKSEPVFSDTVYQPAVHIDVSDKQTFSDGAAYDYEVQAHSLSRPGVASSSVSDIVRGSFTLVKQSTVRSQQKSAWNTATESATLTISALTVTPRLIDAAYLQKNANRSFTFTWHGEGLASEYSINITDQNKRSILSTTIGAEKSSYTLNLMTLNDSQKSIMLNGTFTCNVTAVKKNASGATERSKTAQVDFRTNIVQPQKANATGKRVANPYGVQ